MIGLIGPFLRSEQSTQVSALNLESMKTRPWAQNVISRPSPLSKAGMKISKFLRRRAGIATSLGQMRLFVSPAHHIIPLD